MQQLYPDLWQTQVENPFSDLNTHAYLLQRPQGNLLIYNSSHPQELDHMEQLGGFTHQLLSHRHEYGENIAELRTRFRSKLCCDAWEAEAMEAQSTIDITFGPDDGIIEDLYIVRTPGHTRGGLCYLYDSPHGKRYLFTGDSFYLNHGEWSTIVIEKDGGNAKVLAESLEKLQNFVPDVVFSSASVGDESYATTKTPAWQQALTRQIMRLNRS
ncbi:hypothetical protein [Magnetococcus sp. PR-3]|uniref:hypothetical protein n=1 Tax=Magnetococcus sp. PR-3 TaxID=3120355 RepID=UPI002FCDF394